MVVDGRGRGELTARNSICSENDCAHLEQTRGGRGSLAILCLCRAKGVDGSAGRALAEACRQPALTWYLVPALVHNLFSRRAFSALSISISIRTQYGNKCGPAVGQLSMCRNVSESVCSAVMSSRSQT